jgi:hypothetical protein
MISISNLYKYRHFSKISCMYMLVNFHLFDAFLLQDRKTSQRHDEEIT